MSYATKRAQRPHWNTGWLSWTELKMQKHRNNRAFSHEVPKHSRHWGYRAHHSMWQVHLVALLALNSFQISCHDIFFSKKALPSAFSAYSCRKKYLTWNAKCRKLHSKLTHKVACKKLSVRVILEVKSGRAQVLLPPEIKEIQAVWWTEVYSAIAQRSAIFITRSWAGRVYCTTKWDILQNSS